MRGFVRQFLSLIVLTTAGLVAAWILTIRYGADSQADAAVLAARWRSASR